jgi:hypothetical protein
MLTLGGLLYKKHDSPKQMVMMTRGEQAKIPQPRFLKKCCIILKNVRDLGLLGIFN